MKFKSSLYILSLTITTSILHSCAPAVTKANNAESIALSHKTIAILPPKVIIEIKDVSKKDEIYKQEVLESDVFHKNFYEYLQKMKNENKLKVNLQDYTETKKLLQDNNVTNLSKVSYKELLTILDVDAIITSRVSLAKPLTNAEALLSSMATFGAFSSKVNTIDISIINKNTNRAFWNYNWIGAGVFESNNSITKSLMKAAANRFPYKISEN
ncbi:hypothetical protein [Elizabethkingia ursingii]